MSDFLRAADHLPPRYNAAAGFIGRHAGSSSIALIDGEGALAYAELDALVRRFANALLAAGVRREERVAFIAPDTRWLSIGFWGAIAAGAVAVPVNTLLKPADHRYVIEDCGARLVITDAPIDCDAEVWSLEEMRARIAAATPVPQYADTHRDSFAFFLYSSGTTGEPKGVVHLQHDMWVCCETYGRSVLDIRADDRCFSVAKLFFAYGLGNAQYFPFHVGASAVLFAGHPKPEAIFEQVRMHRPTLFFGVPTAYANMLAALDAGAEADFSSVRLCASAGEALPGAILER